MRSRTRYGLVGAVAGAVIATLTALAPTAAADGLTLVPCSDDELVEAVETANSEGGGDLILAPGCTYELESAYDTAGLPQITTPISMLGAATTITRTSSAPEFRIFDVGTEGELTLTAVAVRGGVTEGDGAGILNAGTTTLNASSVSQNSAGGQGGGIASSGELTINNGSRVNANTAVGGGGGIASSGTLNIGASSIDRNSITGEATLGGGVLNDGGDLTVNTSSIGSNTALAEGASGAGLATLGGSASLDLSFVESNRADTAPGGIYNEGSDIVLTLTFVFANSPSNCSDSPDSVPGCVN